MRNFRMEKLAELKKVAETPNSQNKYEEAYGSELGSLTVPKLYDAIALDITNPGTRNEGQVFYIEAAGYYLGKNGVTDTTDGGQIERELNKRLRIVNLGVYQNLATLLNGEEKGLHRLFTSANQEGNNVLRASQNNMAPSTSNQGSGSLGSSDYPPVTLGESREGYIQRAKDGGSKATDTNLGSYYDNSIRSVSGGGSLPPSPRPHRSGPPQATTGSSDATAVIKQELWSTTVSDNGYKYLISNDGKSFNWMTSEKSGTHKQGDKNWGLMVQRLNLLTGEKRTPTSAAPAATTDPAKPEATPGQPEPDLVAKIQSVLTMGMTKPLDVLSGGNEKRQITEMTQYLTPKYGPDALAKIIAAIVGGTLGQLNAATKQQVSAAGVKDLGVNRNGAYSKDVGIIMRQVNLLHKQFLNSKTSLEAYFGKKTGSSLDNKFVKAATLRRLKIRSQMEAAIDSSAQMGRARVS